MNLSLCSIEVSNFRGVRGMVELDFTATPSGLYFVRGENREGQRLGSNGSGKSTIFTESVIWAFTGRTSRAQRPGADVENRTTAGTTKVEVVFSLDGRNHVLCRTRNPNALLLNNDRVEQHSVDAILPLSDAALRKSILIDQFSEMFLDLRPEAKSQIFTETLNLDRWLRASSAAGERALATERKLQKNAADAEGSRRALAEARDQLEAAIKGETEFEDKLKERIADARKRHKLAKEEADNNRAALDEARGKWADNHGDQIIKLNELRKLLSADQHEIGRASGYMTSVARDLEVLERRKAAYTGSKSGVSVCPECGQQVDEKHKREKLTTVFGEIEGAHQRRKACEKQTAELEKRIHATQSAIQKLEAAAAEALEVQTAVSVAAERSLAADKEMHRIAREVTELKASENPFTKQCDALEQRVKKLREELADLKDIAGVLSEDLEICKFWVRGFKEIRLDQIDAALAELEMAANRHAEALGLEGWRIAFATERETKKGTVSHGFTVSLFPPGEEDPVSWETYSGGESQRWQLAVTFGLAEVLLARAGVSTDFEVLDEPTSHLSPEGIEDLLSCLYDRARELNRRIFLIDHNSLDRGSFDGVISIAKTKERGTYIVDAGGVLLAAQTEQIKRERVTL